MYKIAVIFESSPYDRKGLFNAVHERIRALVATGECEVDAYCIHSRDNAFTRFVRHTPVTPSESVRTIDGISYRMLWYRFSILDHLTVEKLHKPPLFFGNFMKRCLAGLQGYDLLIAHSFTGALFAYEYNLLTGCPYFVNWHGSDIHTHPWRNSLIMEYTKKAMLGASRNFFVSRSLLETSEKIVSRIHKDVIYNGVSESFARFSPERLKDARKEYRLTDSDKVVAFVGTLASVKNVFTLRPVFQSVRQMYEGRLVFWMVGDGKLGGKVREDFRQAKELDVVFWGNLPSEAMPSVMNCIDVMVLPSKNEGFPLVCAEAVRCGANVVGADVGGIPEAIGRENVVAHGEGFVEGMASKIVGYLKNPVAQSQTGDFSWTAAGITELRNIREISD